MALKLMYITNRPEVAVIAEKNSVDRIWVDLEWRGKEKRQHNLNTVKSKHVPEDVSKIRGCISKAQLMVRVNPLYEGSRAEIDEVIRRGAELIMLPMFKTAEDAARFVEMVGGRAKVMLLVETMEAERNLSKIVRTPGIDEIHIGLNDLHLAHKMSFMFELLADGHVDALCSVIRGSGIPYGFGGIAKLDGGMLPARHILAEHYRLGSSMAILSRSFYDAGKNTEDAERAFREGIREIRDYEKELSRASDEFFIRNHALVRREVEAIVAQSHAESRRPVQ